MVPVRTCIGCRARVEQSKPFAGGALTGDVRSDGAAPAGASHTALRHEVVRLSLAAESRRGRDASDQKAEPAEIVLDLEQRAAGRGAWLHADRRCLDAAVKRKAFRRAFRRDVRTESVQRDFAARVLGERVQEH